MQNKVKQRFEQVNKQYSEQQQTKINFIINQITITSITYKIQQPHIIFNFQNSAINLYPSNNLLTQHIMLHTISTIRFGSYTPIGKDQQKKLTQIINNLIDLPESTQFLHPVPWKQLQLDDYPEFIKNPMNLYKVQEKMKNREYGVVEEVLDHLQLIWDNCKEYNKEGGYFELAEKMEKAFRKMIKNYLPSIVINYVQKPNPQVTQPPATTQRKPQPQRQPPSTRPSQPKPQPKPQIQQSNPEPQISQPSPQPQEIPLQQKNRLHQRLKLITQQQLAVIVQLIQQHAPEGFKHVGGGRYQILVDNIDGETFRKMTERVDDFIESEKGVTGNQGQKKVKI